MTTTVEIVKDSVSKEGIRLTTFKLRYPRFIHAELMTHRVFSRNASSSRAIPVQKMIEDLQRDPAMPIYWGSNKPGMQAGAELDGLDLAECMNEWRQAMERAIVSAQTLMPMGLHKQVANRILEPWAHINVVVTATDYQNFFTLRCDEMAQPEIKELADEMQKQYLINEPDRLQAGEWHLPFVDLMGQSDDRDAAEDWITRNGILRVVPQEHQIIDVLKKVSVARCARTSYLTHEGKQTTVKEDMALHERLVGAQPLHASPAEHQATPDARLLSVETNLLAVRTNEGWKNPSLHGNFTGWVQYRKTLAGEFIPG